MTCRCRSHVSPLTTSIIIFLFLFPPVICCLRIHRKHNFTTLDWAPFRHKRVPSTQPPTNRHSLPIHITTLLTAQKQSHTRNLIRHRSSAQGVQLSNLVLRPSRPRSIVHDFCHARLNHAGTDCVDSYPSARELVTCCLRDVDDGGFGSGVICSSGVGAYACD